MSSDETKVVQTVVILHPAKLSAKKKTNRLQISIINSSKNAKLNMVFDK